LLDDEGCFEIGEKIAEYNGIVRVVAHRITMFRYWKARSGKYCCNRSRSERGRAYCVSDNQGVF
jgi:hypothetical protein